MKAPIAIMTYHEVESLAKWIELLSREEHIDRQVLIFSIGAHPKKPADTEKIQAVKSLLIGLPSNFKVYNEQKYLSKIQQFEWVMEKCKAHFPYLIVIQDNFKIHEDFWNFMDQALEAYESDANIWGVCGYAYPGCNETTDSLTFLPLPAWGIGLYTRAMEGFDADPKVCLRRLDQKNIGIEVFDFGGFPYFELLKNVALGYEDSYLVLLYALAIYKDAYFVYPNVPLIRPEKVKTIQLSDEQRQFFINESADLQKPFVKVPFSDHHSGKLAVMKQFEKYFYTPPSTPPSFWDKIKSLFGK